ncbi:MAG: hypothetical protein HGA49_00720 [Eubacteriaceae bacterium]|nr:hypothetical protein [Eubacteriaceae bacterium]
MLNIKKKMLMILLAALLVFSAAGCNLVQVDPEKDLQQVVIKMNDQEILKKEFNGLFTYYKMMYTLNGYEMPVDEELATFKEDLLDTLVEIKVLRAEAEKAKVEVDLTGNTEQLDADKTSFISGFGDETKYSAFLVENNMTVESFQEFYKKFLDDASYANAYMEKYITDLKASPEKELAKTVMAVSGSKILKSEFYYELAKKEFLLYTTTGSGLPTDEEGLKAAYDEILDSISENHLVMTKGKADKITVTAAQITAKSKELKENYFAAQILSEESLPSFLSEYYLSSEVYEKLLKKDAEMVLYKEAVLADLKGETTVTENEMKEYYESNKTAYDTSTVAAKHILVESEDLANQISATITDAASFEAAFEKYQDDETVLEASDLGAFKFTDMVTEFGTAAFALNKGEVTKKPVKSQYGYHMIYVYDKNIVAIPTYEEKKSEIKEILLSSKTDTKYSDLLTALKKKAKIEKNEIQDPYKAYMDQLKKDYNVKTYPNRIK